MKTEEKGLTGSGRETLSVAEAARVLGIGRNAAYAGVHAGQIPSVRVGGRILIPRRQLDSLLRGGGA